MLTYFEEAGQLTIANFGMREPMTLHPHFSPRSARRKKREGREENGVTTKFSNATFRPPLYFPFAILRFLNYIIIKQYCHIV
jgi:hypothetical protein